MASTSTANRRGETLHETEIAFHLRISDSEPRCSKAIFFAKGFIDEDWNIVSWDHRQFVSDSSTDRTRRNREGRRTSQQRCGEWRQRQE